MRARRDFRAPVTTLIVVAALSLSVSALSACAVIDDAQSMLFDTTRVNLIDTSYAAADMLAPQTKTHMTPSTPLHMAVITDVNHPGETTAFGRQLVNHLASRFVQLGYNVQGAAMPPNLPAAASSGAPVALVHTGGAPKPTINGGSPGMVMRGGDCTIGGNFTRLKKTLLISLRISQGPEQKVIAAYDYSLPMTRELDDLSMGAEERAREEKAQPLASLFSTAN